MSVIAVPGVVCSVALEWSGGDGGGGGVGDAVGSWVDVWFVGGGQRSASDLRT